MILCNIMQNTCLSFYLCIRKVEMSCENFKNQLQTDCNKPDCILSTKFSDKNRLITHTMIIFILMKIYYFEAPEQVNIYNIYEKPTTFTSKAHIP